MALASAVRVDPDPAQPENSEADPRHRGFSLIEALIALALLALVLGSVGQLAVAAVVANGEARHVSALTAAALEKMEQLRGLAWGYDDLGMPVSDTTSDVSVFPPRPAGGRGLLPSPEGTLDADTPGYVDYLAANGSWTGNAFLPGSGSIYVRRWAVSPLAACPGDGLVLRVRAGRLAVDPPSGGLPGPRLASETVLITIRIRAGG